MFWLKLNCFISVLSQLCRQLNRKLINVRVTSFDASEWVESFVDKQHNTRQWSWVERDSSVATINWRCTRHQHVHVTNWHGHTTWSWSTQCHWQNSVAIRQQSLCVLIGLVLVLSVSALLSTIKGELLTDMSFIVISRLMWSRLQQSMKSMQYCSIPCTSKN